MEGAPNSFPGLYRLQTHRCRSRQAPYALPQFDLSQKPFVAFGTAPEVEVDWSISNGRFATGTAKLLNISDPHDPEQAISGATALMKEAAQWSRAKIANMPTTGENAD